MRVCILNTYETSLINDIILSHNENVTIFNTPPHKYNTWEQEYINSSFCLVLFSLNSLQLLFHC